MSDADPGQLIIFITQETSQEVTPQTNAKLAAG